MQVVDTDANRKHCFRDLGEGKSHEKHTTGAIIYQYHERLRIIEEQIQKLEEEREELRKLIDRHRVSPIQRMPPDILGEIFVKCLPDNQFPRCSVKDPPLLLTTICRTWRNVALHTPSLWSEIHVHLPSTFDLSYFSILYGIVREKRLGVLEWLKRSGSLPISFAVFAPTWHTLPKDVDENPVVLDQASHILTLYESVLEVFCGQAHRWKEAELRVPSPIIRFLGERLAHTELPQLRILDVIRIEYDIEPEDFRVPDSLHLRRLYESPSLRSLFVVEDGTNPLSLPVKWGNLVDLQLLHPREAGIISQNTAFQILRTCCHNLQSCVLTIDMGLEPLSEVRPSNIEFENLEEFSLEFDCEYNDGITEMSSIEEFFSVITAPALTTLSITTFNSNTVAAYFDPPFLSVVKRSKVSLSHLELLVPCTDSVMKSWLRHVPSLSMLKVSNAQGDGQFRSITDSFIHTFTGTDGVLCPNLVDVYFQSVHPSMSDALIPFAKSRTNPPDGTGIAKLKAFKVDFSNFFEPEATLVSDLETLRNSGMKVRWRSPESLADAARKEINTWSDLYTPTIVPVVFDDDAEDPWNGTVLSVHY